MTFERGAAFDDSTRPNPAVRPPKPASQDRSFLLALIIGILIGFVLAALLGIGLYAFGWIEWWDASPATLVPDACPATAIYFLPECPTNAAGCFVTSTPTITPTPEPTLAPAAATPDFAATATQACSTWRLSFPGTPCPPFLTPTP